MQVSFFSAIPAAARGLVGHQLTDAQRAAFNSAIQFYELWSDVSESDRASLLQSARDLGWAVDLLERGDVDALEELLDVAHSRVMFDLNEIAKAGAAS